MSSGPHDYLRDPDAIYRRSFEIVRAETDLEGIPVSLHPAAIRIVHACGMPDVVSELAWGNDPADAVAAALREGKPVFTDTRMVAEGIIRGRLPLENEIRCTLGDPRVRGIAARLETTRSAAAVDLWVEHLEGAVVAIGNAPTALFRLLELLGQGAPRPGAILGFPVGFVGAAESKVALAEAAGDLPYLTLHGRRGGSAIACAAINAMAGGST